MWLLRLTYKPIGIVAALIAGRLGRSLFRTVWSGIDDAPPPTPGSGQAGIIKLVGAQALQAAVTAGTAAAVDRAFAGAFHELIGIWPAKPPEPEDEK